MEQQRQPKIVFLDPFELLLKGGRHKNHYKCNTRKSKHSCKLDVTFILQSLSNSNAYNPMQSTWFSKFLHELQIPKMG